MDSGQSIWLTKVYTIGHTEASNDIWMDEEVVVK